MDETPLDNIVWHSLVGDHAAYSAGTGSVRRYASGFPPVLAFADPERPNFPTLAPFCAPDEALYTTGWSGPVPSGWQLVADGPMFQMVWRGALPDADAGLRALPLKAEHLRQALALVGLTKPGPFGERSFELGRYLGVFEGGRLVAMAGERFRAEPLVEISAVCSHPDFQGRGLARRLIERLVHTQRTLGQTPFLHVMQHNTAAVRLYERMGFVTRRNLAVRVIARWPG
ncbi:MAG TPA: GNAT family N-acetyltransferase [Rubrivivax sp.]